LATGVAVGPNLSVPDVPVVAGVIDLTTVLGVPALIAAPIEVTALNFLTTISPLTVTLPAITTLTMQLYSRPAGSAPGVPFTPVAGAVATATILAGAYLAGTQILGSTILGAPVPIGADTQLFAYISTDAGLAVAFVALEEVGIAYQ
jgi:hypothetical protein